MLEQLPGVLEGFERLPWIELRVPPVPEQLLCLVEEDQLHCLVEEELLEDLERLP